MKSTRASHIAIYYQIKSNRKSRDTVSLHAAYCFGCFDNYSIAGLGICSFAHRAFAHFAQIK